MSHLRTLVITATRSGAIATAVINRGRDGPDGPSAYDSYVATTADDPVLSEAAWIESLGGGGSSAWGGITGTLADQTDLQAALDAKAAASHTHVSADVTDATSSATPATLVLRGANGEAEFGAFGNSFSGNGVYGASDSGTGVFGEANTGTGVFGRSVSGTGLIALSVSGTNHAEFGYADDDRSFIRRVLGLIGWHRGNYVQTLGSPATLTADSALELPDAATGTLARREDIASGTITPYAGNLDFSGGLGGGGADFSTNKATLVAGDKIALLDSEASDAPKHGLLSAIVDFIIGTGRTLSGAWAFASTTRPTSSGTGIVSATDLVTLTDTKTENAYTRNLFRMAVGSASGTGAIVRRGVLQGIIDGDITTTTSAGAYYKIALVGGGGSLQGIASSCVDLSSSWQFMLRMSLRMPSTNGHLLFCIGADGASGVPSSGVNVGMEITSQTSVRLWRCNSGAAVYSSAGTVANMSAATKTHDHFFWLANNGAGQLDLYYANKTFAGAMPARPTSPICTLTGVASGLTGSTLPAIFMRAIDTPLGNIAELLLRDASFTEY